MGNDATPLSIGTIAGEARHRRLPIGHGCGYDLTRGPGRRISTESIVGISGGHFDPADGTGVKSVQLTISRPVARSTSMNSLSAASTGSPLAATKPLGLVAAVTSKGPVQVRPQSVERCMPIVCTAAVADYFATRMDEYTNVQAPRYFTSGSPNTCGSLVVPMTSVPGEGSCPPSTNVLPPSSE